MRRRRASEIIAGRVNGDGSIAAGDGFTVQKGTTGVYTITFAVGFRLVSVTANHAAGSSYNLGFSVIAERSCQVNIWASNTVASSDQPFLFTAVGIQQ